MSEGSGYDGNDWADADWVERVGIPRSTREG
jgi:hypothetical protein